MADNAAKSATMNLAAASEETPLLQANAEGVVINGDLQAQSTGEIAASEEDDKPLPKAQLFLLCYCRMVEPIAFFSIFPFINKMIEETGVEEQDVGFYSGLIESLFSLTQMMLMISWGRAADKFGRKPVLVFSLIGVSLAVSLFGLSKALWQMILFRCLAGVFSGTIVTIRTMVSEISTTQTQARSFSFFAFAGNLGILLGPIIGGSLADPARQYGGPFAKVQFLLDYPYALPSFITGVFGLSAVIITIFFVEETFKPKSTAGATEDPPLSTWKLLKSKGVPTVLFLYNFIMLMGFAYTAVAPVFWYTSVHLGGFAFTPLKISLGLGAAGLSQAIWTLLVFPPAQHRWGTGGVMRFCSFVWVVSIGTCPLGNYLLRQGWTVPFWIVFPLGTTIGAGASMSFTCVQLALNDISPSPAVLGTLNAVALALMSGVRAVAPALFASLFATGVRNQILHGYFAWAILMAMALFQVVAVRFLPREADRGFNMKRADDEHED